MTGTVAPRTRVIETLEREEIAYRLLPHGREVIAKSERVNLSSGHPPWGWR